MSLVYGCKCATCAVYYTGMLYLHNDSFVTDIIGYDRLNFSYTGTFTPLPEMKCWVRH